MAENEKYILTNAGKVDYFNSTFQKLMCENVLNEDEKEYLLRCAIIFIQKYEQDTKKNSYFELAYYIILKYSITYHDFEPLYDFSFNYGFYPIVDYINREAPLQAESIEDLVKESILKNYKEDNITYTLQQKINREKIQKSKSENICYIAPTSFGKSSIVIDLIKMDLQKKYAIIVPTKSLLSQTYRNLKKQRLNTKLISHDEMYQDDKHFVAIFTQERALRLLESVEWGFDCLFIDEAHNIFENDMRNILLTRLIRLNRKRNLNSKLVYLSPLINDASNLSIKDSKTTITPYKINNNIKIPEIYFYDDKQKFVEKYNKYFNKFYPIDSAKDLYDYINKKSSMRNLIYFYRPKTVENFSIELSKSIPKSIKSKEIQKTIKILKKYVHEDFNIISCLSKGIIYLHGKIPEYIKDYLEFKFKQIEQIKYLIGNGVILEGVNLPISSLFILDPYKLNFNKSINLIGRINRLSEIFGEKGDINKLLPQIHYIKSEYCGKNTNMKNYIEKLRDTTVLDEINNPLLEKFNIEEEKDNKKIQKSLEIINNEKEYFKNPNSIKDKIRHSLISNGIQEFFDINENLVKMLMKKFNYYKTQKKSPAIIRIFNCFFGKNNNWIIDSELKRLQNQPARKYYRNYLEHARFKSLKRNINTMVRHFNKMVESNEAKNHVIYIGRSYGEVNKNGYSSPNYQENVYINLKEMTPIQRTNIAIIKLKIEEDMVSYKLNKFIDMALEYEIISEIEYNYLTYGLTDPEQLKLIKQGFPLNILNKLCNDNQIKNITFNELNIPIGNFELKEYYNKQDDFYKFQIDKYITFNI